MAGFSQLPFTCSQDEEYVGSENFFSPATESESAFKPYFPEPSSTSRPLVGEIQPCDNNLDAGGKETQDEEDCQIVEPTKKRRSGAVKKKIPTKKKNKNKEVEEEDLEEKKKNWPDSHVEQLIAIRGEMHGEFQKNAKKQGVDTWIRLQARMLAAIPEFSRTGEAYRKKFENIFKSFKDDKLANSISGNNRHECKFYDSLDQWWHQSGSVIKHVSATTMDSANVDTKNDDEEVDCDAFENVSHGGASQSKLSPPPKKKKFHDQALIYFGKMVDNGAAMLEHFGKTNELLGKIDQQMEHLIDKL